MESLDTRELSREPNSDEAAAWFSLDELAQIRGAYGTHDDAELDWYRRRRGGRDGTADYR